MKSTLKSLLALCLVWLAVATYAQPKPPAATTYLPSGTTTAWDSAQPVRSIPQEDALLATDHCIRWLLLADYYAMLAEQRAVDPTRIAPKNALEKATYYRHLHSAHSCTPDHQYRYQMLQSGWYPGTADLLP